MTDGDALFRAVCESPADDTPRLVYADWLDENGRPERAEFIRLQCEAWNLCPAYPTLTAARTRASALLKHHGDAWFAELPRDRGISWGALFVRGFIDTVRAAGGPDPTGRLNLLFSAAPLIHLTVTSLNEGELREVLNFPLLSRLVSLRIPGTRGREEARLLTEAQARLPNTTIY